jgi:hypothetical protein
VLVVAIASTRTTAGAMSATASYGLQSMTPQISDATTSALQHTWFFTLNNAGIIAAGANDDLAVTASGGTHQYSVVYAAVYIGVNQTTPVSNSRSFNNGNTANNQVEGFASALTNATGDQAVEIVNLIRSADGGGVRSIADLPRTGILRPGHPATPRAVPTVPTTGGRMPICCLQIRMGFTGPRSSWLRSSLAIRYSAYAEQESIDAVQLVGEAHA